MLRALILSRRLASYDGRDSVMSQDTTPVASTCYLCHLASYDARDGAMSQETTPAALTCHLYQVLQCRCHQLDILMFEEGVETPLGCLGLYGATRQSERGDVVEFEVCRDVLNQLDWESFER